MITQTPTAFIAPCLHTGCIGCEKMKAGNILNHDFTYNNKVLTEIYHNTRHCDTHAAKAQID